MISGLLLGKESRFSVAADNGYFASDLSEPILYTHYEVPSSPRHLTYEGDPTESLLFFWVAPENFGGYQTVSYVIKIVNGEEVLLDVKQKETRVTVAINDLQEKD